MKKARADSSFFLTLKILALVVIVVSYFVVARHHFLDWERNFRKTLESLAKALSYPMWTLNQDLIAATIENMLLVEDLLEVLVVDERGNLLAQVSSDKRTFSFLDRFLNVRRAVARLVVYYKDFVAGQVYFRYYYWTVSSFLLFLGLLFAGLAASVFLLIVNFQKNWELRRLLSELNNVNAELEETLNELEATQQKVINSEKMAALGKLMVNIAHDVNTPTGVIFSSSTELKTRVQLIEEKYRSEDLTEEDFRDFLEVSRELADIITRNSEKIRELVQSLKRVAMQEVTGTVSTVKLRDLVDDVLRTMYPKLRKTNVKVNVDVPDELTVKTVPGAWVQILMNLLDNSIVHGFEFDNPGTVNVAFRVEDAKLVLFYSDDGKGMQEEVAARAFEPFFTTDPLHGTGLGLSIVYQLAVDVLHGDVELKTAPGAGVKFTISAPLSVE